MDSDHVEDVFAADPVIRRDIARVVRDGLVRSRTETGEEEQGEDEARVPLDTLGYVAATVSKRADASMLRGALERAATVTEARLVELDTEAREARFAIHSGDPDARLELEEAIADELAELYDQGLVELPAIERRIDLGRTLSPNELRAAEARIDAIGQKTLFGASFAAAWDFVDARTLRLTFTPLSEQDARDVDLYAAAFQRELANLAAELKPVSGAGRDKAQRAALPSATEEAPEEEEGEDEEPRAAAPRRRAARSSASAAPAEDEGAKGAASKRAVTKRAAASSGASGAAGVKSEKSSGASAAAGASGVKSDKTPTARAKTTAKTTTNGKRVTSTGAAKSTRTTAAKKR